MGVAEKRVKGKFWEIWYLRDNAEDLEMDWTNEEK